MYLIGRDYFHCFQRLVIIDFLKSVKHFNTQFDCHLMFRLVLFEIKLMEK